MFRFEKLNQPLLTQEEFIARILRHTGVGVLLIFVSLLLGIVGYHNLESLSWVDSLLNASMILGGMGPVSVLQTDAGKVFASFYALYSGAIFLIVIGIVFAPVLHRFLHRFHLDERGD